MLTARREPVFHSGEQQPPHAAPASHAAHSPSFNRFMTVVQVAGSLLAIPLGLASGYSIYHSNFSAEARCQALRANIISMLDKSADASTLRMLVRRDVADFEHSCGTVDPDAVAAFKTLLASGKKVAPVSAPVKEVAHEPVRRRHEEAKREVAKREVTKVAPAAEAARERREAASADAKWVASVREALIHAPAERAPRSEGEELSTAAPAPVTAAPPVARTPHEAHVPAVSLARRAAPPHQAAPALAPAASIPTAPALPPAASVAVAPVPAHTSAHPVPPGYIPDSAPMPTAAVSAPSSPPAHTGIRGVIADIPLLGRMVGK